MSDTSTHEHEHEHGGFGTYMGVFLGLVVLTVISFALGNSPLKQSAPAAAWAGMMAVSCGKAMLVILFFMHLKWEANWKYVLTVPAMMMSVFLVCMLIPDVGMRRNRYAEERVARAASLAPDHAEHGDETGHSDDSDHGSDEGGH